MANRRRRNGVKILSDERGQALVLTALCMAVLLGALALAIDVGLLFRAKRNMQIAADAAATAGALDYLYNGSVSSAKSAAKAAAAANGVSDGTGGAQVTPSMPPIDGPNTGNTSFMEVQVSTSNPTFFMKIFNIGSVTVAARAVAGIPTAGNTCLWLTSTSGVGLMLQGSYDIESPGCGIYVNSPSSNAFSVTGNGGTINAAYLDVVGNSPPSHQTSPTPATMNAAPRTNPYGNLTGPTPTNGLCTTTVNTSSTVTGKVNAGGLANAICYTKAVTVKNATLGPGIYVFEKGVTISGTVTVNGGTLDVYGGSFNQSNGTLALTAPTSGAYNGIAIMQPASNTNELQIQFGSSTAKLDGIIYAPGAEVYMQDNGGNVTAAGIVASYLYVASSTLRLPSYAAAHPSTAPGRVVSLVE